MISVPKATDKQLRDLKEKIYKMYYAKDKSDFEGSTAKYECIIDNERGIFKERRSLQSKDHIMEQVAYELAIILGIDCCKASCRKVDNLYGAFSRYEVNDLDNVITYSNILHRYDMFADEILEITINKFGFDSEFIITLYKYMIFDFILGQIDRHLDNLSVYKVNNRYIWYPLYDNGLCCFSAFGNDNSITFLNQGFYHGRMGSNEDMYNALRNYRDIIYKEDLRYLVQYNKLSKQIIYDIINRSDKYNQIKEERKIAMINFIWRQLILVHQLNLRQFEE